jgi:hypothetical protein
MSRIKANVRSGELNGRLDMIPMLTIQRAMALNALSDADAITDAIMWAINGIKRLVASTPSKREALKRTFKHNGA